LESYNLASWHGTQTRILVNPKVSWWNFWTLKLLFDYKSFTVLNEIKPLVT